MAQNIYDDAEFLEGYSQLDRSIHGLAGALEWETLRAMLPPLQGLRVLDLGCGFGWFCRWAVRNGAISAVGVDVSEKMLERAEVVTESHLVHYRRQDLEQLEPSGLGSFGIVYSSLALHYLTDLGRLFTVVRELLPSGGHFVFSVEHPIFSAPTVQDFQDGPDGRRVWPLDNYLVEGRRVRRWFVDGVVKQHRTVATYVNELVAAGFDVKRLVEFGATDDQVADPGSEGERHRPQFLLVAATRT